MRSSWPTAPLETLVEDILDRRGVTPLKLGSDFTTAGHRVISAKLIKGSRLDLGADEARFVDGGTYRKWMRSPLKADDVLLTSEAPLGEVAYLKDDSDWCLGQRLFAIRTAKQKLHGRFLFYALQSAHVSDELRSRATGTTVQGVRQSELRQVEIPVPPLAEQVEIAEVLGALDDKIELNRRMNATLEAMARALFQSWFVDFDPVRAKLDGRPPAGLDPANAALFPEHFAHLEHDLLPVGWRRVAVEEVCAINALTLSKNDDFRVLEYVEISEVSHGNVATIATYPRGEEPSRARRRLRHGDTVLSTVRPDRGSYFLALSPPDNRVASTGFAVLTPTEVPWSFLHAALTLPEVFDHLGQMADGGAYPAVRPEIIGAMPVALPNEPSILSSFHRICAPLFERADVNRAESRTLTAVRDTMLPRLLSGELVSATCAVQS